jgi:hypothetical protein
MAAVTKVTARTPALIGCFLNTARIHPVDHCATGGEAGHAKSTNPRCSHSRLYLFRFVARLSAQPMCPIERPSRWTIAFVFALVYVFWGSTYLGIDIAIQHIPPALMCAIRFSVAGTLLLVYCWLAGQNIRYSARQLAHYAIVGLLGS